jgi:electron transport complex protein RnfD
MNHLAISSSPHFRAPAVTKTIMADVIIALLPAFAASVWIFGVRAFTLTAICVAACILFEYAYRRLTGQKQTIEDMSAVVTGMLLAFNLPVTMPLWQASIGCFAAIVIVKQLFGGIGKNFANPAIVGRIVLLISFATNMTTWQKPSASITTDAVTGATPLAILQETGGDLPSYFDLFIGQVGGSMGETCKLALLLGGAYLVFKKVITVTAPLAFMGTVFLFSFFLGGDPVFHLLSGGVVLGAIFMATDYSTTPTTELGKLIFGVGCGLITVLIRMYASYPEGVSFAILLMNLLTQHIDNLTAHKAFGGAYKK